MATNIGITSGFLRIVPQFGQVSLASPWFFYFDALGTSIQGGTSLVDVNFQGTLPECVAGTNYSLNFTAAGVLGLGSGPAIVAGAVFNPMYYEGTLVVSGSFTVPVIAPGAVRVVKAPVHLAVSLVGYDSNPMPGGIVPLYTFTANGAATAIVNLIDLGFTRNGDRMIGTQSLFYHFPAISCRRRSIWDILRDLFRWS
jgi:hypothetical protein